MSTSEIPSSAYGGVATDLNDDPSNIITTSSAKEHLRMRTNTAEIDSTITHPGSVKINVKGAFIVDQETSSSPGENLNGGSHDTKDIRLPNHTAVVSHIAVDVRISAAWLQGYWEVQVLIRWFVDRRITCETRILLPRTSVARTRWATELY